MTRGEIGKETLLSRSELQEVLGGIEENHRLMMLQPNLTAEQREILTANLAAVRAAVEACDSWMSDLGLA